MMAEYGAAEHEKARPEMALPFPLYPYPNRFLEEFVDLFILIY